jgi:hypothetical protein
VGGYAGLCGGVSTSEQCSAELSLATPRNSIGAVASQKRSNRFKPHPGLDAESTPRG